MRERIILAFIELAVQKGFSKITMDELATKAGISKRTIYTYFSSKEELIEVVVHKFLGEIGQEIDIVLTENKPLEEIFDSLSNSFYSVSRTFLSNEVLEDIHKYYPAIWKQIDEYRMGMAQRIILTFLKRSGKEYDCGIISTIFIASLQAVMNPEYLLKNGITYEQAFNQLVEFLKYGLIGCSQQSKVL